MRLNLSVEETNRIRDKLGLRLIPTESSRETHTTDGQSQTENRDQVPNVAVPVTESSLERNQIPVVTREKAVESETLIENEDARAARKRMVGHASPGSEEEIGINNELVEAQTDSIGPPITRASKSSEAVNINDQIKSQALQKDPLEAAVERPKVVNKERPTRATFKVKKRKSTALPRASVRSDKIRAKGSQLDEFETILLESGRLARSNGALENQPNIFRSSEPDEGGLLIKTRDIPQKLSSLDASRSRELNTLVKPEASHDDKDTEDDTQTEEPRNPSTHLTGVAGLVHKLSGNKPTTSDTMSSVRSKSWARKLAEKRRERELELKEVEKTYQNVPSAEREEALAIYRRKLAEEEAKDTQQLVGDYQPEVNLVHSDGHGHVLDKRKAFRELSKAFHEKRKQ